MARPIRKIIAVDSRTGERREFGGTYAFAKEVGTTPQNVQFALNRNGLCCGWKLYDTPENLRKRIKELERQLAEIEGAE